MNKIRVLFLTTYFAPDNIIGAVRPSVFCKYLNRDLFDITVIRSGRILGKPDNTYMEYLQDVRILSYDGENSAAEQYQNGEYNSSSSIRTSKPSFAFLKTQRMRRFAHVFYDPVIFIRYAAKEKKKILRLVKEHLINDQFDVVFATYGDIGNIVSAPAIRRLFNGKLIVDMRDPISLPTQTCFLRHITKRIQKSISKKADVVTCVSQGLTDNITKYGSNVVYIPNGFAKSNDLKAEECFRNQEQRLTLFYGGELYSGRRDLSPLFSAIQKLMQKQSIDSSRIRLIYAGNSYNVLQNQANKFGLEGIIENHGFVTRNEVIQLQNMSDIFLVATWNTINEQGVLTGKFYEGIQNRMPIIAIVTGGYPDSEIGKLIKQYNIGCCYEDACESDSEKLLMDFIETQYSCKVHGVPLDYHPKEEVFSRFDYQNITNQLETIIERLVKW